jgi:hypothetical protein
MVDKDRPDQCAEGSLIKRHGGIDEADSGDRVLAELAQTVVTGKRSGPRCAIRISWRPLAGVGAFRTSQYEQQTSAVGCEPDPSRTS